MIERTPQIRIMTRRPTIYMFSFSSSTPLTRGRRRPYHTRVTWMTTNGFVGAYAPGTLAEATGRADSDGASNRDTIFFRRDRKSVV